MSSSSGPLEVPLFQGVITEVCTEFAQEKGVDAISFYHDMPMWIISQEGEGEIFRMVQIAAWHFHSCGEGLQFVSCIYKKRDPSKKFEIKTSGTGLIIPCQRLTSLSQRERHVAICALLERAWEKALAWTEADLGVAGASPQESLAQQSKGRRKSRRRS